MAKNQLQERFRYSRCQSTRLVSITDIFVSVSSCQSFIISPIYICNWEKQGRESICGLLRLSIPCHQAWPLVFYLLPPNQPMIPPLALAVLSSTF